MNDLPVIEAHEISKTYSIPEPGAGMSGWFKSLFYRKSRTHVAVHPFSFTVNGGDITGLVGPNGAGKSTLIKMLTGILCPDTGTVRALGRDPFAERQNYCRQIGVVFGQRCNLWWDLPASESFQLVRVLYRIPRDSFARTLSDLDRVFGLSELMGQPVRTLSLGQRMRCSLAAALLPCPRILFLDEPTIGLDAVTVAQLIQMLQEINRLRQTTILITSHDLAVIEKLCGRILLFDQGAVVFDGTVLEAVQRYARYKKLRLAVRSGQRLESSRMDGLKDLGQGTLTPDGIEWIVVEGQATEQLLVAEARALSEQGIADYFIEKPSLQEVILNAFR